jgi:60 kDa SS-A/Ro ribonucleoprotein
MQLYRFLILGTEKGTYYITERKLTADNAAAVRACLKEDFDRTLDTIVAVSDAGRAPKNDPAVFALAMAFADARDANAASGGSAVGYEKLSWALQKVCRTGTHLYQFVSFVSEMRGWGKGLQKAVQAWFNDKDADAVAYQIAKYTNREGWNVRDVLLKAHVKPQDDAHAAVYGFGVKKATGKERTVDYSILPNILVGCDAIKGVKDEAQVIALIHTFGLTREMVPTEWLNKPAVQEALLQKMPLTAMVRNLVNMSKSGLLTEGSEAAKLVVARLGDAEYIHKSRVHPLTIMQAYRMYHPVTWLNHALMRHKCQPKSEHTPVKAVVDALDAAFYLAFDNVEPTGKKFLFALDVSASMSSPLNNMPYLSCCEAGAALALVTAAVEADTLVRGFTCCAGTHYTWNSRDNSELTDLGITRDDTLASAANKAFMSNFGGTDCALPMVWARKNEVPVDCFIVCTDNETWANKDAPHLELVRYREAMGIPAKSVVIGMQSNGFTIADPSDAGMVDFVGFDTTIPQALREFVLM